MCDPPNHSWVLSHRELLVYFKRKPGSEFIVQDFSPFNSEDALYTVPHTDGQSKL